MQSQTGRKQLLITGATGSSGTSTVASLIQQGHAVRALVYREDERSSKLHTAGAEVIVGDMLDLDDARGALEGVDGAYFVYPIAPGLIEATAFFAQAAKEAGIGSVVNMSQISARRDSKSHAARDHSGESYGHRTEDAIDHRRQPRHRTRARRRGAETGREAGLRRNTRPAATCRSTRDTSRARCD